MARIVGTNEDDFLEGGDGDDVIFGRGGNDIIVGSAGRDYLSGDAGDDQIEVSADNLRRINGGDGNDVVYLIGQVLVDARVLRGGAGFDQLDFSSVTMTGFGRANGFDVITKDGFANDRFSDFNVRGTAAANVFDFSFVLFEGFKPDGELDRFNISGLGGDDRITGTVLTDRIDGGDGNDQLAGVSGNDILIGGAGNDRIDGGDGTDVAVFSGNSRDYAIRAIEGGFRLVGLRAGAADGIDTLVGVERVRFSNGEFAIADTRRRILAGNDDAIVIEATQPEAAGNLLANDGQFESETEGLRVTAVGLEGAPPAAVTPTGETAIDGARGRLFVSADGSYRYELYPREDVPALDSGESLTERFTYTVAAARGPGVTATLTVLVGGNNELGANNDLLFVTRNVETSIDAALLSANDTTSGLSATVTAVSGLYVSLVDGRVLFDIPRDVARGQFQYTLTGANGESASATAFYETAAFNNNGRDLTVGDYPLTAIVGGRGADLFRGFGGRDQVDGGAGDDILDGGGGADRLVGGLGDDRFRGGASGDAMTGDSGADRFLFDAMSDFGVGDTLDRITDFSRNDGDRIELDLIDPSPGEGDQAFAFIDTAAFGGIAGQLRYEARADGDLLVQGDVDGDGAADFAFLVAGVSVLQASDFLL